MAKKTNGFVRGATTRCDLEAHVHVGALGRGHRGCPHNNRKALCTWKAK